MLHPPQKKDKGQGRRTKTRKSAVASKADQEVCRHQEFATWRGRFRDAERPERGFPRGAWEPEGCLLCLSFVLCPSSFVLRPLSFILSNSPHRKPRIPRDVATH